MRLSDRMEALLELVPGGSVVADVGCDHGFVSMELIRRGICSRVIAMDLREGPLSRAREHIAGDDLQDRIETRLSDGFAALTPGEADCCIIAGMGGRIMQKILTEGRDCAKAMKALILQPQSEIRDFRIFLRENSYRILRNKVVLSEGKYYFPILAAPGLEEALPPEEQELADRFGRDLLVPGSPLLPYLEYEHAKLLSILDSLGNLSEDRLTDLKNDLSMIESALHIINS